MRYDVIDSEWFPSPVKSSSSISPWHAASPGYLGQIQAGSSMGTATCSGPRAPSLDDLLQVTPSELILPLLRLRKYMLAEHHEDNLAYSSVCLFKVRAGNVFLSSLAHCT